MIHIEFTAVSLLNLQHLLVQEVSVSEWVQSNEDWQALQEIVVLVARRVASMNKGRLEALQNSRVAFDDKEREKWLNKFNHKYNSGKVKLSVEQLNLLSRFLSFAKNKQASEAGTPDYLFSLQYKIDNILGQVLLS